MKSKYILIGALIFAIATTVLFGKYIKDLDKKYKNDKNMVQIVVLKQDTLKNTKITKEMLEIKPLSVNAVHPDAVKKIEDIEGSYALVDMKAGEVLFPNRFSNQSKEKELITRKIKEGNRAISIEVNYVESVSTMIEPEDYVDVYFTEKGAATTKLLENIRVLAVGKRIIDSESVAKTAEEAAKEDVKQVEYSSVTLELTPEQVQSIVNADERGNIKFALRSKFENK